MLLQMRAEIEIDNYRGADLCVGQPVCLFFFFLAYIHVRPGSLYKETRIKKKDLFWTQGKLSDLSET